MKRIILGVLLVVGVSLFGVDHGLISGFEVGYNFIGVNQILFEDKLYQDDYSDSLSIKMVFGYRIENLRIIGTYTNTLKYSNIDSYMPVQDNFKIEINYTVGNFKIGFYHWCDHPVISLSDQRDYFSNAGQRSLYLSFYKEF